jgi:WD40 repeat protein
MSSAAPWASEYRASGTPLAGHTGAVNGVAICAGGGGLLASCSADGTVRLYDLPAPTHDGTGAAPTLRHELKGHTDSVSGVAFADGGACLASAGRDGAVRVWDAASGECTHTIAGKGESGHDGKVCAVAFAPGSASGGQGVLASAGADKTVRIWRLDGGGGYTCTHTLRGHKGCVRAVAFDPAPADDNVLSLVTGGDDKSMRRWEVPLAAAAAAAAPAAKGASGHSVTVRQKQVLDGHSNFVWGVAFASPRALAVAAAAAAAAPVAVVVEGAAAQSKKKAKKEAAPKGPFRLASASRDGTARLWDEATGRTAMVLKGHKASVRSIAFSPVDARVALTASDDKTLKWWDTSTGACTQTLRCRGGMLWGAALDPRDGANANLALACGKDRALLLARRRSGAKKGAAGAAGAAGEELPKKQPRRKKRAAEVDPAVAAAAAAAVAVAVAAEEEEGGEDEPAAKRQKKKKVKNTSVARARARAEAEAEAAAAAAAEAERAAAAEKTGVQGLDKAGLPADPWAAIKAMSKGLGGGSDGSDSSDDSSGGDSRPSDSESDSEMDANV